jgi:peptidoglycan hydrolase CwlO-like protein
MGTYARLRIAKREIKMKNYSSRMAKIIRVLRAPAVLVIISCFVLGAAPFVHADSLQQQIDSLNAQNAQADSSLSGLSLQASSYQDAINKLQDQIGAIQGAINANEAQQASLQQQIQADEDKITQQKQLLSQDIEAMYVNGQMTTIEMLATSSNLSSFVDAETYRGAVQAKLQGLLTQIAQLEDQQESQKTQLQQTLTTQQAQQGQLTSDQSQQTQLLAMNQTQQASYNQQIQANNAQISSLRAQQAAANASVAGVVNLPASGGSGGACDIGQGNGGYPMPWCNAPQDTISTLPGDGGDNRECTSFAYWYFVTQEGQSSFRASGNAGWWWETSNYPVTTWNSSVKVGALGIEPSSSTPAPVPSLHGGYYGHVMVVKALPGQTYQGYTVPDGDVLVASMNEDEAGHFMYNTWPVDYLMFINPQ